MHSPFLGYASFCCITIIITNKTLKENKWQF